MSRFLILVLLTAVTALGTQVTSPSLPSDKAKLVTFNKDVLPILQRNCQTCHRPGDVAPMSFLTYESTRPWAKAIKAATLSKKMPPWFADPHYGGFRNAPELTQVDIQTLAAWADNGAKEGNPADKPADIQWVNGWRIQPDVVVSMPEPYHVRSRGEGEIKEFFIPNPFKEDTWITSIEVRPGDPSVVHHVIVQVPEQTRNAVIFSKAVCENCEQRAKLQKAVLTSDAPVAVNARRQEGQQGGGSYGGLQARFTGRGDFTTMEAVYAPGTSPLDFRYHNSAKLIRGGKPIRLEVHYTPNGKETNDQTMVGFTLAKEPAQRRFVMMAPDSLVDSRRPIPAGEANWESTGELTFTQDAELVWFMPHMHLRGKDMTFTLVYPNGREETVLSAKFNFNWQLGYEVEEPIKVPRGTKMIVTAHHDNSANNPNNPNPNSDVKWGEMTSEEMMLPWFGVVVNRDATPDSIASYRPGGFAGPPAPVRVAAPKAPNRVFVPPQIATPAILKR